MRVAAIDMGTNTFLCLVADVTADGLKIISDQAKVVRLGEKVHQNRAFLPEALGRAKACLQEFRKDIIKLKPAKVIATATSAARDAKNGDELRQICEDLEIPLHIIEGSREAELSFAGALSGLQGGEYKKILVVDVGGGSTELIYKEPGVDLKATSFDVGCVRLTEMFLNEDPVNTDELENLRTHARAVFSEYGQVDPDVVVAVAGTPTTLACVAQEISFNEEMVEGYILSKEKIHSLEERLAAMPLEKRKQVKGLDPLRADVIVAGAVLLEQSLELVKKTEMRVSTRGLRFGVALKHGEFK